MPYVKFKSYNRERNLKRYDPKEDLAALIDINIKMEQAQNYKAFDGVFIPDMKEYNRLRKQRYRIQKRMNNPTPRQLVAGIKVGRLTAAEYEAVKQMEAEQQLRAELREAQNNLYELDTED